MAEPLIPFAVIDPVTTPVVWTSDLHVFSIDDILGTYSGLTYADEPTFIDTDGSSSTEPYTDKQGNILYPIDSEFGFHVTDFIGAEDKVIDGEYTEGFAGNLIGDLDGDGVATDVIGLALYDAETDIFKSSLPLGTWSMGLGGMTVKASTEHYNVMAALLSDQKYLDDPDAIAPLDNDLKIMDRRPTGVDGALEATVLHDLYVDPLVDALQIAIDNVGTGNPLVTPAALDFDGDGTPDPFTTLDVTIQYDDDGDGVADPFVVGGVDLDNDGTADVVDGLLNGYGTAGIQDILAANESSINYDIAYSSDYSVTVKDDGKLLYRWGTAVKRPNDLRTDIKMDLPEEWTRDLNENGIADSIEDGAPGFEVTRAELVITHTITNNPNDQIRPEDYENEAATGRGVSYYVVTDPDDPTNELWVSVRDSYDGEGTFLPSYLKLDASGAVDMTAGGTAVYDPDGVLVGYRNEDASGFIGTVFRDLSLVAANAAAGFDAMSADLTDGFTNAFYTSIDRDPFQWSYDEFPDDPYKQVFVGFSSADEAADAGYTEEALVSGPRWRLLPNKFGQDLPGLEIPLEDNSEPPFQRDNIKYDTGELTTTTINLLDWDGESPFSNSQGWMLIDPTRLDENADGKIDDGWSLVNGTLGAGDDVPTGPILTAVTPNGATLTADTFDTSLYVKGDRQDSVDLFDMQLIIEYESVDGPPPEMIGTVQQISSINHEPITVAYQGNASFMNPVAFAAPVTLNGSAAVTTEFSNVGAESATLYLEEPDYLDGLHTLESVTLLTLEEGEWTLDDGSFLQVGTYDVPRGATNTFYNVTFDEAFEEAPIVILQIQTNNGSQWEIVRAQNVTTTGFELALQEEQANNNGAHMGETVGWAAIDTANGDGTFDWNGIGAQAFSTGATVDHSGDTFVFNESVGLDPLITAAMTTFNGSDAANLRLGDVTNDGTVASAEFFVYEEQSYDNETQHVLEEVNGFAFEMAGVLTGELYTADLVV